MSIIDDDLFIDDIKKIIDKKRLKSTKTKKYNENINNNDETKEEDNTNDNKVDKKTILTDVKKKRLENLAKAREVKKKNIERTLDLTINDDEISKIIDNKNAPIKDPKLEEFIKALQKK